MRNLVVVIVPALALGAFSLALHGRVDGRVASGALAVAIVPAPLFAGGVVTRLRGRMDLTGALVLGTVLVSLLVVGGRGALASGALFTAAEAYALAAMFANALPPLRDALLPVLRVIGWAAFAMALLTAVLEESSVVGTFLAPPIFVAQTVGVALALVAIGVATVYAAARGTSREPLAAIAGSGLRDPVLAVALATITAGPDATGVPVVYAVFCLVLAGIALLRR